MSQEAATQEASNHAHGDEHSHGSHLLGPILCWAVVFADIGTSVYYVPGILYGNVGNLAGFFVFLTMSVFVLLTLKYAEVSHRFPQGGGVVTVAAQAINQWVGALGGMFILVDYFLTAALSCLSGVLYFSVVVPAVGPYATWITVGILLLLGTLNWIGISESAKVSLVGAAIAFVSDLAILFTVFTHISFPYFLSLFGQMFHSHKLSPVYLLIGFAGSFLAFSGLESISQLSPVMRTPRKKTAGLALLLVVLTIGITSPLLTMFSTLLQPAAAANATQNSQLISLLGGHWGNIFLQTEMAISASALLVFASNTAIIGSYHVFMALSRMDFFPSFVLKRNRLRGTPHYSIALATLIPTMVIVLAHGSVDLLGNLYAFGLLGAFTLTCLGLDLVRYRERRAARAQRYVPSGERLANSNGSTPSGNTSVEPNISTNHQSSALNGDTLAGIERTDSKTNTVPLHKQTKITPWSTIDFWLGMLTTFLVAVAWIINLIYKPDATLFGGTVASVGMLIAFFNYRYQKQKGRTPVMITGVEGRLPGSVLAVLTGENGNNDAVIRTAINHADGHPVVFLYVSDKPRTERAPSIFEVVDPYLDDLQAKEYFSKAENLAEKAKVPRRYVYRQREPGAVALVWQAVHPHDIVVAAKNAPQLDDINPDRIRYELTSSGKVAHMLKQW
ncbi:MAG: APC family permease [Ktedonobacteraceae bacterium]